MLGVGNGYKCRYIRIPVRDGGISISYLARSSLAVAKILGRCSKFTGIFSRSLTTRLTKFS